MQDFSAEGGLPNLWGSDFRGSERNLTIWQSPNIWGNFAKICIKINKNSEKLLRKFKKNKEYNMARL